MHDDEFAKATDQEALHPDMPEWPKLSHAQRTFVALECFLGGGISYDALSNVLSARNSAAYCDALEETGFSDLARLVRKVLETGRDRMDATDEFFELFVELELQHRALWDALEAFARTNHLFPRTL